MALPQFLLSTPLFRCRAPYLKNPIPNPKPLLTSPKPRRRRRPGGHVRHQQQQQQTSSVFRGSSSLSDSSSPPPPPTAVDLVELPLLPLPLVLFPGAILPLPIFEFRHRIMMQTLLQTGLRFGVIFSNAGAVAGVGCVGEIVKHERLVDERFFLICKGQERFRVSRIVRTRPYLVAEVAWLEEEDRPPSSDQAAASAVAAEANDLESLASEVETYMRDAIRISSWLYGKPQVDQAAAAVGEDLDSLASEVEGYMRDVIRISKRLKGKPEKEEMDLRRNLFPTPFSFFVGSTFEGLLREQQALLELEDTATRLRRERDTLRSTRNYLTAAAAVKDAFPSPSSSFS